MPRYWNEDVTVQALNKDSDGLLVDADSATLKTRMNADRPVTSTPTKVSTGTYQQVVTPKVPGVLFYRFELTNSGIVDVEEGRVRIHSGGFEDQTEALTDYV